MAKKEKKPILVGSSYEVQLIFAVVFFFGLNSKSNKDID